MVGETGFEFMEGSMMGFTFRFRGGGLMESREGVVRGRLSGRV